MKGEGGYTLMEVLVSLAIISILLVSAHSMFFSGLSLWEDGEAKLDSIQNARHAVDTIANEIKRAEKIIDVKKINGLDAKFPGNFDFVIQLRNQDDSFSYVLYYLDSSEGKIKRVASKTYSSISYPEPSSFKGYNEVAQYVVNNDSSDFQPSKKIINISIKVMDSNSNELTYENKVSIRCPIDA